MATRLRGVLLACMLALLAACEGTKPTSAVLRPDTSAYEQLYQEGRAAFQAGKYEEATANFARLAAADPQDLRVRLNWAAALSRSGKPAEAIVQCQQVLARDPTSAEAYYQWGAALARLGQHKEALEKFDQALELKPAEAFLSTPLRTDLVNYMQRHRRQERETTIQQPKRSTTP